MLVRSQSSGPNIFMPTIESQINYRLQRIKKPRYNILTKKGQFLLLKFALEEADIFITNKKVYHLWTKLRKITIGIDKKYRY
jgi:hypothetical protein